MKTVIMVLLSGLALSACTVNREIGSDAQVAPAAAPAEAPALPAFAPAPAGEATAETAAANRAMAARLPLDAPGDATDARRGFLAALDRDIVDAEGNVVWSVDAYDFLAGDAPATVNPSLWRQSRLAAEHGLFEVTDGIWQVRGYDLAVMSIIRGETGWIVVDPLLTRETAAAALGLVNATLGERPVSAVIYTHSHADHFGGVRGIIDEAAGVPVIAPEGFSESAVTENLLAGTHMSRRSGFMFGAALEPSPTGHVGAGLGPALAAGTIGLILPTEEIPAPGATRVIDGVTFEFLDAKNTEAPAEFVFFLPKFNALCTSEVATATFHNALTLRGAKVRDTLRWSKVIDEMLVRYANRADVVFASHHWPTWGAANVRDYLRQQRDIYRYAHDQTLRLANSGATMHEIAEAVPEPGFATDALHVRDYYGTLNHNLKAIYQFYFGWWDGVPANFHILPPEERARRWVAAMGGADAALEQGIAAFEAGDYRWAAELLNQVVFAEPERGAARDWLAAAYEQMGFQAESGAWRSYYLSAARELREGPGGPAANLGSADFIAAVPSLALFDALAARYIPGAIEAAPFELAFVFSDTGETITMEVGADTAVPRLAAPDGEPVARLDTTRAAFNQIILQQASPQMLAERGELVVTGDPAALAIFLGALETPDAGFAVVTP